MASHGHPEDAVTGEGRDRNTREIFLRTFRLARLDRKRASFSRVYIKEYRTKNPVLDADYF